MASMFVDNIEVEINGERNVLEVIRKAGIEMPVFCYHPDLSIYGACRMCIVENEYNSIEASCSMVPRDGMRIRTNTKRLQKHRKMILELILSSHCRDCTTCAKNGECKLQEYAKRFGIDNVRFENYRDTYRIDDSSTSIVRDPSKCILCGNCVRMCSEVQNTGILDFAKRGSKAVVMPAFDEDLSDTKCVNCGQCSAVCPTGALTIKDETDKMWDYLSDDNKKCIVQIAPAVRAAIGEEFGVSGDVTGQMATALRMLGFEEVYDTVTGADLTVLEEANEFIERVKNNENLPLFTSCCPAWIRYAETKHPELINKNISSCRSPMQMFGSVLCEMHKQSGDERELISVAIMPCTAKKYEASRKEFVKDGKRIIELSLTTKELIRMIRTAGIQFASIKPTPMSSPFTDGGSGAGVIFGVTGGVAEAVVRYCVQDKTKFDGLKLCGVRGMDGIKEASIDYAGREIKICVVHGLKNVEAVIKGIQKGEMQYDIIEVMACPTGCVGGAGQPVSSVRNIKAARADILYNIDDASDLRESSANKDMSEIYDKYICGKSHELLHVHYEK